MPHAARMTNKTSKSRGKSREGENQEEVRIFRIAMPPFCRPALFHHRNKNSYSFSFNEQMAEKSKERMTTSP
jgi:hypothetical protein